MNPDIAQAIDLIQVNLNKGGMDTLNIVLAFVMFGVALGIKPSTLKEVFKKPKSAIIGIVCQNIFLPAFTLLLAMLFNRWISPMMALGMILVASCPGGNISNFMSYLSKANTELSVSLTAINTALSVFTTPANFAIWGGLYLRFADIKGTLPELQIPFWDIFQTIFILLGIPLILGMLCSKYLPKVADLLQKPLKYLSILIFIAMVVIMVMNNMEPLMQCIKYIFIVVFIHNLCALLIGFGASTAFKLPRKDRRTITIETGIQNSGLGLILLFNPAIFGNFPPHGGMLVITAMWGIWHIVSGLGTATIFNLHDKRKSKKAING